MALERLSSTAPAGAPGRALVARPGAAIPATATALPRLDPVQPLLRLRVTATFDGGLLARGPEGQQLQIPASALAGQRWEPGQLLLVRVVGTTPQLELAVLGLADEGMASAPPRSGGGGDPSRPQGQPPAVQPDQAGMHRLLLAPLQVPALAAQWRSLVLAQLRQSTPGQPPAAASPMQALHGLQRADGMALGGEPPAQALQGMLVFHALVWPGVWLTFWPLPARARPPGQRKNTGQRLGLELDLPGLGPVRVDLELQGQAVAVVLCATGADAVALLHSRATLAAASLARSHLRLLHWQVLQHQPLPPVAPLPASAAQWGSADLALPPGLFRAAAEVLNALSPPFR
ncbi:hypothetical protein [Acidovorax sp.]|uniref:hypothetical protein n=1 Tax=Acidovorax sp. TaxID=1872122 RepID=UPI002ACD4971|nr:hypothetical protein [Acidovorax sp.]MDZ7862134.1 hypothetical protein [Acidovorax sp.]